MLVSFKPLSAQNLLDHPQTKADAFYGEPVLIGTV